MNPRSSTGPRTARAKTYLIPWNGWRPCVPMSRTRENRWFVTMATTVTSLGEGEKTRTRMGWCLASCSPRNHPKSTLSHLPIAGFMWIRYTRRTSSHEPRNRDAAWMVIFALFRSKRRLSPKARRSLPIAFPADHKPRNTLVHRNPSARNIMLNIMCQLRP
jgi:hypothetical protein